MRIAIDLQGCQSTGSRDRGIGRYSMALAEAMLEDRRGHDFVIALNGAFPDTILGIRARLKGLVSRDAIRVFDVPAPVRELDPANLGRTRAAEHLRENFLGDLRPDLVQVSSLFEGLSDDAVTSIGAGASAPRIVTLYDLIPYVRQEVYLADPRTRQWYLGKLASLRRAELILAISEATRREAIAALGLPEDRIVNISAAVGPEFRTPPPDAAARRDLLRRHRLDAGFLLYAGGIDYRKNIEGLIDAYAQLPAALRQGHQLAVVCAVTDADRDRLLQRASRLAIAPDRLRFTGYVSDADLIGLYSACEVFVFPSVHEGFGLPVLEAMACGAAVIGSNSSSIPEVIGRSDALFDPERPAAIAAKLAEVLGDPVLLADLRVHGPRQAATFSWSSSASRALDAMEALRARGTSSKPARPLRPRLAWVSPLPPARSGIADYSADLVRELAEAYAIELVVARGSAVDTALAGEFPVRDNAWLADHGHEFDRIVYHFGNSSFHEYMFDLIARHPGTVVLHDFFLGGVLNWMEAHGDPRRSYLAALYESHGYAALARERRHGRIQALWDFPASFGVISRAMGIIVHSAYSARLAGEWFGLPDTDVAIVPMPRRLPVHARDFARRALGVADDALLVCSFGVVSETKLNHRLLDAFFASSLASDPRCRLVLVGDGGGSSYEATLRDRIAAAGLGDRIAITGFAETEVYAQYLAAADIAVQLRTHSRGETSASALDCLASGIALIVNANGAMAELPARALVTLPDLFSDRELVDALEALAGQPAHRRALGTAARDAMAAGHSLPIAARGYHDAIERFAAEQPRAREARLLRELVPKNDVDLSDPDLAAVAGSVYANRASPRQRQMLVDVTAWATAALHEMPPPVRHALQQLLEGEYSGWRMELVRESPAGPCYARSLALELLGIADAGLRDEPIDLGTGDVALHLDFGAPAAEREWMTRLLVRGGRILRMSQLGDDEPVLARARSAAASTALGPAPARATPGGHADGRGRARVKAAGGAQSPSTGEPPAPDAGPSRPLAMVFELQRLLAEGP